jgi:hypothetical protein
MVIKKARLRRAFFVYIGISPMIKIYFPLFLLLFILQECIVPQFAEPQPAGIKNKSGFPPHLWGKFNATLLNINASEDNYSNIFIDSTHLHLYEIKKVKAALSDVKADTTIKLIDGYVYAEDDGKIKINPYKLVNDTIYYTDSNKVELSLSGNCILREWKGHYFLNNQRGNNWDVLMMDAQNDNSYIIQALILTENMNKEEMFSDPGEIPIDSFYYKKTPVQSEPKPMKKEELSLEDLNKITSYTQVNDDYIIKPSRAQLNKLIKKKFFKEVWRIERVK